MKRALIYFFLILLSAPADALWDDCPFGKVNDTYPGDCSRYIDTDKDGICDHSQPAPNERNSNLEEEVELTQGSENPATISADTPSYTDFLVSRYNFIPLSFALITLIIFSEIAAKKGIIEPMTIKYLWNAVLALSFFTCFLASLPSIFPALNFFPKHLFVHVEAGLVMAWITLYHIWGRRHFYTKCFPKKLKKCR